MARIRTIKPEFFRHEGLFDLEERTGLPMRLAFAGLWTQADREGRFKWRPRTIKSQVLPFDAVDFATMLDALAQAGFVQKYQVDGEQYGVITSWSKHQAINHRESQSEIPPPETSSTCAPHVDDASGTRQTRVDDTCPESTGHARAEGKGREGKGRERNGLTHTHTARGVQFPAGWDEHQPFLDAWSSWCQHHVERFQPLTGPQQQMQVTDLSRQVFGPEQAAEWIRAAVAGGWRKIGKPWDRAGPPERAATGRKTLAEMLPPIEDGSG